MNIDKDTLLNLLHSGGHHDQADQAAQQLPDQIDPEQHAGLLSKLGINLPELLAKFGGGNLAGGLGGLLGGGGGSAAGSTVDPEGESMNPARPSAGGTAAGGLGGLLGSLGR